MASFFVGDSERVGRKSMSVEENKRLAREAIKILTTGDLDAADALYAPDYVNHQHHDPEDPRDLHGVQAMKTLPKSSAKPSPTPSTFS
jgi:ketosteroid isomerase-like protein